MTICLTTFTCVCTFLTAEFDIIWDEDILTELNPRLTNNVRLANIKSEQIILLMEFNEHIDIRTLIYSEHKYLLKDIER